jgi:hypothetical protein
MTTTTDQTTEKYLNMIDNNKWVEVEAKHPNSPGPKHIPDPNWQAIDNKGHEHRYVINQGTLTTPTLAFIERFNHFVCRTCGERVEPGRITVYSRQGKWLVNGKVVEDEVAKAVLERLGREA